MTRAARPGDRTRLVTASIIARGLVAITRCSQAITLGRRDIAGVCRHVTSRGGLHARLREQLALARAAVAHIAGGLVHANIATMRNVVLTGGLITVS